MLCAPALSSEWRASKALIEYVNKKVPAPANRVTHGQSSRALPLTKLLEVFLRLIKVQTTPQHRGDAVQQRRRGINVGALPVEFAIDRVLHRHWQHLHRQVGACVPSLIRQLSPTVNSRYQAASCSRTICKIWRKQWTSIWLVFSAWEHWYNTSRRRCASCRSCVFLPPRLPANDKVYAARSTSD